MFHLYRHNQSTHGWKPRACNTLELVSRLLVLFGVLWIRFKELNKRVLQTRDGFMVGEQYWGKKKIWSWL
ncbi:hypothetical protein F511_28745 [Dorcoceras hygrometricum]|uniref:Uncharacterized protein n=1 Tax=Dorcoceras hygrometricum TaxID=472368 RepID=A0A2Z7DFU3_9LAMI|nr:hypothetical protein F511_28745 [Dorcoceras hygrometricum]